MAPTGNSAKAFKESRPRPAIPKTIVPAIPLPYIQKRTQQVAAREKIQQAAPSPVVETTISTPTPPPVVESSPVIANGSSNTRIPEKTTDLAVPLSPGSSGAPAVQEESREQEVEEPEASGQEETPGVDQIQEQQSAVSESQSSASRSTYQMPPPFYPAHHNQPTTMAHESVKFPPHFNGQSTLHHGHPSAGSLVFGNYPDSNNSSPAPPLSAGNVPPYPFPQQGQHGGTHHGGHPSNGGHHHHISNGYSPMAPPPPGYYPRPDNFMSQGPSGDQYVRRPMVSFGPADSNSPSATPIGAEAPRFGYDPSTPHSFHGSQSSAPNDQDNNGPPFYSQYPSVVAHNESNGNIDEVRLYQQPRPKVHTISQPITPAHGNFPQQTGNQPPMVADNLDGLLHYLQNQFGNPSFADYTLELRYSDDRAIPVRIPGHNLLFARSPTLKDLMMAQAQENNSDGLTARTLLIESDDRFLRSDAFWMAAQRLYGGPLLDFGVLAHSQNVSSPQSSTAIPGTPSDRFELGLGYAAAGHILRIPPVISRGIDVACHFISWTTLEKALDFALDGGLDQHWNGPNRPGQGDNLPTYGPAVEMLIHASLHFLISSFPPNFDLDTSVITLARNQRLPPTSEDRPVSQNLRLSSIKFGDHPSEEAIRSTPSNPIFATLSKVLLNLPFPLLQYVLESPRLGNVSGWATTALRHKVMHTVIDEREKRRTKAHANIQIPNAQRKANAKQWAAVGWKETVQSHDGNEEIPTLARTWIDYLLPSGSFLITFHKSRGEMSLYNSQILHHHAQLPIPDFLLPLPSPSPSSSPFISPDAKHPT
ncbi:hypothetical protein B7494_g4932 [Chlorociboria aeruginascens]|nr:hypothetical protein B7494_g4932 [Chlorociboria aeruginascens]